MFACQWGGSGWLFRGPTLHAIGGSFVASFGAGLVECLGLAFKACDAAGRTGSNEIGSIYDGPSQFHLWARFLLLFGFICIDIHVFVFFSPRPQNEYEHQGPMFVSPFGHGARAGCCLASSGELGVATNFNTTSFSAMSSYFFTHV